jgi:hypothetical protein
MSETTANQPKAPRTPRKATKAVKPAVVTEVQPNSDIADNPVIEDKQDVPAQTTPEPSMADKIRMMHEAAKMTEKGAKFAGPREGDIVAMLDNAGEIVTTYTVRRRGTVMAESGTNRTIGVPSDKLTQIEQNVWTFPMPTFQVNWDKVYKRA